MNHNDPRLDEIARRMTGISDRKWKEQSDFIRIMRTPVLRSLAAGLGVDVDGVLSLQREVRESTAAILQAAIWFGPLGWTVSGHRLKSSDYVEAVHAWEVHPDEAAIDDLLTRAWADGDGVWLRGSFGPITTLAGRHEPTLDILLARNRVLKKALTHHERGEYEASTMLVLAQIDGLTADFTPGHGFFHHGSDQQFIDHATVAGMPEFLATVYRAVNQSDNKTSLSSGFRRHPIMHGRYIAFGTETNSTKAFALLSGVLEWLKPKAAVLTEIWQRQREASSAGSDEQGEEGYRLDNQGLKETGSLG